MRSGRKLGLYKKASIPIDVGAGAIDRDSNVTGGYTFIDYNNPANADGIITSVEIFGSTTWNLTGVIMATFTEVAANTFTARESVSIGSVTSGSKQTFSVNLAVVAGDYLGIYFPSGGRLESTESGFSGVYRATGDKTAASNQAFTLYPGDALSLYGTGLG